tara:strand:- start:2062 stop:2883 length:822 start_codon:yes stop_codon:yes gene_type:complete
MTRDPNAEKQQAVRLTQGLLTKRGKQRDRIVAGCGRLLFNVEAEPGKIRTLKHACKDRACPYCDKQRAQDIGSRLRAYYRRRTAQWDAIQGLAKWLGHGGKKRPLFVFATLTQPKRFIEKEGAEGAIERLLDAYTRMTKQNRATGRAFRALAPGGVRAIEVTFSKSSGYAGFHAHAHCIFELAPGVTLDKFKSFVLKAWCLDGARRSAQDLQIFDETHIGQLSKRVTDSLDKFRTYADAAREVVGAMVNRRMIDGFGSWRRWRAELPGVNVAI